MRKLMDKLRENVSGMPTEAQMFLAGMVALAVLGVLLWGAGVIPF